MIKPGTYKAKILHHAISETSKGNPQAAISFSFEVEGKQHSMNWYGQFTEKALPHTTKALLVCGLKGNNPAGDLEIGKEVLIVVEYDVDENGQIKRDDKKNERMKISWVNSIGGIRNTISNDLAKAKLAGLEGAVMLARQKLTGKPDSDDIPF